jgi:collagenase-like PrtC family protease
MAATKEEIKELAEHIYDLDAEVYVHPGTCFQP